VGWSDRKGDRGGVQTQGWTEQMNDVGGKRHLKTSGDQIKISDVYVFVVYHSSENVLIILVMEKLRRYSTYDIWMKI
jgi:hypothetical protein